MSTPEQRSRAASLAANASWARTPVRAERTEAARRALEQKWYDKVDPDRTMDPAERHKAAMSERKVHYQRLSRAGNRAQEKARTGGEAA